MWLLRWGYAGQGCDMGTRERRSMSCTHHIIIYLEAIINGQRYFETCSSPMERLGYFRLHVTDGPSPLPGPSQVLPSLVRDQSHPCPFKFTLQQPQLRIHWNIGAQSSKKTLDVQSGSALTKFEDLPPTTRQLAPAFTQCPASHLGAKKQVILSDKRGSVRDLKLTDMRLSHCHGYALWPGSERHPRLKLTSSVAVLRGHEVAACSYAFRVPGTCTSYVVCEHLNP